MIKDLVTGLHHITGLSGSARNNARFYTEILGLRLVKKTVNFDSPDTWHLYYGDKTGSAGSITTFFPFVGITRGKPGNKSVTSTMYSIGIDSIDFWSKRLKTHQVDFRGPFTRFEEEYIYFEDYDGLHIELIANSNDLRTGCVTAGIPAEHAIKGLFSVAMSYASAEPTLDFMTRHMSHSIAYESEERVRIFSGENQPGKYVDLLSRPSLPNQVPGTGTVHHTAFLIKDDKSMEQMRAHLYRAGFGPSTIIDRKYFKSVYFREPGGVLVAITSSGPGFLIDESEDNLGESLMLPHWLEGKRSEIEASLSPL